MLQIGVLACCPMFAAYGQTVAEYQVKAAFLFNFAKFVEWPPSVAGGGNALQICVIGQDPFGNEFAQHVSEKVVNGHKIQVAHPENATEAKSCQILFIAVSEKRRLPDILQELKGTSVLTVADIPDFARTGGIIAFVLDRDRVRFEINLKTAEDAHLRLSARLLEVAKVVLRTDSSGAK